MEALFLLVLEPSLVSSLGVQSVCLFFIPWGSEQGSMQRPLF